MKNSKFVKLRLLFNWVRGWCVKKSNETFDLHTPIVATVTRNKEKPVKLPAHYKFEVYQDTNSRQHDYYAGTDDAVEVNDELAYFQIKVPWKAPPAAYNEDGEYVPRALRN